MWWLFFIDHSKLVQFFSIIDCAGKLVLIFWHFSASGKFRVWWCFQSNDDNQLGKCFFWFDQNCPLSWTPKYQIRNRIYEMKNTNRNTNVWPSCLSKRSAVAREKRDLRESEPEMCNLLMTWFHMQNHPHIFCTTSTSAAQYYYNVWDTQHMI